MARIRTVKPEFWQDQKMAAELTREQRLFYVALWNEADDEGRFMANPRRLLGLIFPFDDDLDGSFIEDSLRTLSDTGRVHLYTVDGTPYAQLTKFLEHQRINRPTPSRIPPPDSDLADCHGAISEDSLSLQRPEVGTGEVGSRNRGNTPPPRDEVFGSLPPLAVRAIKGLYGWGGIEGTDSKIWERTPEAERPRLLSIAVQRLEGEGKEYQGRLFRRIIETVIEENQDGRSPRAPGAPREKPNAGASTRKVHVER